MTHSGRKFSLCFLLIVLISISAPALCQGYVLTADTVTVSGDLDMVEGLSAGTLTITTKVTVTGLELLEPPPETLSIDYTLIRNGETHTPVKEITRISHTPIWAPLARGVSTTLVTYEFLLPSPGTSATNLQSNHNYTMYSGLWLDKITRDTVASAAFSYTVYSGILKFNEVVTTFTTLTPALVQNCSGDILLDRDMAGSWDSGYGILSFFGDTTTDDICANETANTNGYSTDLQVAAGSVDIGNMSGETAGISWQLYNIFLDANGGQFPYLTIDLNDTATFHLHRISNNQVWPTAINMATFPVSGSSFVSSIDEVTVFGTATPPARHYYHNQGLPFYVSATGFSFSLATTNSEGMILSNPKPYYVHEDAFTALPTNHSNRDYGFPSNDAIFREYDLGKASENTAHINQDGISGHMEFHQNPSHTAFPYGTFHHAQFGVDFSGGVLTGSNSIIADEENPLTFSIFPNPDCADKGCSETVPVKGFNSTSLTSAIFSDGTLASRFTTLGNRDIQDSSVLPWGGYNGTNTTFRRNDAESRGIWMVPGFRMAGTAATPTTESVVTLSQILLGSRTFTEPASPELPLEGGFLHPLNHATDNNARLGNGFFAGVTMGPETISPTPADGTGAFLTAGLEVRFNGNTSYAFMPDRVATKYTLRKGGITGIFNTGFNGASDGDVNIYGYNINFSRFSFAQALNKLSSSNLIDGELTLYGPTGGTDGLRVGFTDLAFFCDGNLGSGVLDTEPEPDWPKGNAVSGTGCDDSNLDDDSNTDESCHVLDYWNMPILITGMTFAPASADEPCLNGGERKLHLNTLNMVENLAAPLTMEADFEPDGSLSNQRLFTAVDSTIDQPQEDSTLPGFSLRIQSAYLNQIADGQTLPAWQGFTVVNGLIDVPLFNDAPVSSHLTNQPGPGAQSVYFFDQADDTDKDGIHDDSDAAAGSIITFRGLLTDIEPTSPKPLFEYHWPRKNIIDLSYHASYRPAGLDSSGEIISGKFIGIPKETDLAGVASVTSVADYITPKRTKFSFGIQADIDALDNLSFDAGLLTGGVLDFLRDSLGVNLDDYLDFNLDAMIGNLTSAEELMNDITGGDITELITDSLDEALKQGLEEEGTMAYGIKTVVKTLNEAHQAPYILSSILAEPFENVISDITDILADPDFDFSPLAVDITVHEDLVTALAPFLKYGNEQLRTLYEAYADATTDPPFDNLLSDFRAMQSSIDELFAKLDQLGQAKETAETFLTASAGSGVTAIADIIQMSYTASDEIHNLYLTITAGLGPYISDDNANPIRQELHTAKARIRDVRNAIASVHLGDIADALYIASLVVGSPMDVSMLHAAEETANNAVNELDAVIDAADANISVLLDSLQLSEILDPLNEFLGDDGLLQHSLRDGIYGQAVGPNGLIGLLDGLETRATEELASLTADLDSLYFLLLTLRPSAGLPTDDISNWAQAVNNAQTDLDDATNSFYADLVAQGIASESALFAVLEQLPDHDFITVFAGQLETEAESTIQRVLSAPVINLLEDLMVQVTLEQIFADIVGILPNPSEEDIRTMIRSAIVNQDQIEAINSAFFAHLGFVSDIVDQVATNLISQINSMVRTTIGHLKEELQNQIDEVVADIGPSSWGIASAGIDGYALVSQDEIEKIHLEAEFSFAAESEPTSYNAALDIATWNSQTNASGCYSEVSNGNIDFAISTHDVTASMLGSEMGLREALLGFTMDTDNNSPILRGIFGRVYTTGELGFESMVLYDLGLEAGFGADQNYFAATCAAQFTDINLTRAAFYIGHTCPGNDVLKRLDPQVYEFTKLTGSLTGVYARGSMEMPVWTNGCALTLGVGADMGVWYFSKPGSGTYGGLLGGSAYGELGCLASLKGSLTMIGQKSGSDYSFHGEAWGAAGAGYCSPSKWKSVRDARRDSYCLTGDATLSVDYIQGDLDIGNLDYNCCD